MEFTAYYDEEWLPQHDYFRVHRKRFLQTWAFVEEHARPFEGGRALDIGGCGPITNFLRLKYGMEIGGTQTDLRGPLPVESAAHDIVICTETIEHIKDVESSDIRDLESFNYSGAMVLLTEIRRALKPQGTLVLTTPNANSYIQLWKWLDGETIQMDPNHVREFSVKDLKQRAASAGLTPVAIVTLDSWDEHFGYPERKLASLIAALPGVDKLERHDNIFAAFRPT